MTNDSLINDFEGHSDLFGVVSAVNEHHISKSSFADRFERDEVFDFVLAADERGRHEVGDVVLVRRVQNTPFYSH